MIDFSTATLKGLSVAFVGNKNRYEGVQIPRQTLTNVNDLAEELLFPAMIKTFAVTEEFYRFTTENGPYDGEIDNKSPLLGDIETIFESPDQFSLLAPRFARDLYEYMTPPKAMGGDFFVAYFEDLIVDGEATAGIGLWKVQHTDNFFKMEKSSEQYILNVTNGIDPDTVEVAALILNLEPSEGYRICAIDKVTKKGERSFWKDAFLRLRPIQDNYFNTRHYIGMAHQFIDLKAPFTLGMTPTQMIAARDKAANYFKDNDEFEVDDFEATVFDEVDHIVGFHNFRFEYQKAYELNLESEFEMSQQAVKKEISLLKNVLHLDDNFVVTINGRTDLIENGMDDEKGLRYYKIFYTGEK